MKRTVLVAGFATRHVAQSAYGAGYEVYAVDHFCDQDLSFYTRDALAFSELGELEEAVEEMCTRHPPDLFVATSGAEALASREFCGTSPATADRFLDKLATHGFFEGLGIPAPQLLSAGTYPVMLKPRRGSGGWRNAVVKGDDEYRAWMEEFAEIPYIAEEVVEGMPASVCCLATGSSAVAVAENLQILRGAGSARFGFSGSLTPFPGDGREMVRYAEQIAAKSGCCGTIGIDFMTGASVHAIEVNPRFQATLDTIELSSGMNLFAAHVAACRGTLPEKKPVIRQVAVRRILFAERDMEVRANLACLSPLIADIPWPGTFFEEGQAVVSVYGWGQGQEDALQMLDKHIRRVQQYMDGRLYG